MTNTSILSDNFTTEMMLAYVQAFKNSCGMNRKRLLTKDVIVRCIPASHCGFDDEHYIMLVNNSDVGVWKHTHTFNIISATLTLMMEDEKDGDYTVLKQRLTPDQDKILQDLASGRGLSLNM